MRVAMKLAVVSLLTCGVVTHARGEECNPVTLEPAVEVGERPAVLAVAPDGTRVYVPVRLRDEVAVIETAGNTVEARFTVGHDPGVVAVSPDGTRIFVTNHLADTVSVLRTSDGSPVCPPIPVGNGPAGIAVRPDGAFVYVSNHLASSVSVIDTASLTELPNRIPVTSDANGIAFSPDGTTAYVDHGGHAVLTVIDATMHTVSDTIPLPHASGGVLAVNRNGTEVYVALTSHGLVAVVDPVMRTVTTISARTTPKMIAASPVSDLILVTNEAANTVTAIDTQTRSIVGNAIPVGANPQGVAFLPSGRRAYVTNALDQSVSIIDLSSCAPNLRPLADAGTDQSVDEGVRVSLDGSASCDPDDDPLSFTWRQIAGTPVSLNTTDPIRPTFDAPSVPLGGETLTFELVVNDGQLDSEPDTVDITVKNVNNPPIAHAGTVDPVAEGSLVTLDGTGSYDPDGETLTFSWIQRVGPGVVLMGADTAEPTFTAPIVGPAGVTLAFELTVNDGIDIAVDTGFVIVENVNHPPIADAGADQTRDEGSLVELTAAASSDPDSDPLTFAWVQITGPVVALSDPASATPSFTAPQVVGVDSVTLIFELTADDGLATDADQVIITVLDTNAPPACHLATPSVASLWPPNHKMHAIRILGVTDPEDANVQITILNVTQDEPVNGLGDGDTAPDAVLQGGTVLIRAERAGGGNGRVYVIHFEADDGVNGICTGTVSVSVPHNKKSTCVDDGQQYSSLSE